MDKGRNGAADGGGVALAARVLAALVWPGRHTSHGAMRLVALMGACAHRGRAGRAAAWRLARRLRARYACYVSPEAVIAPDCRLPHPVGIVIGEGVVVGPGCVIFQNVTIGAREQADASERLYPRLEQGVVVYAGAVIVGPVTIGPGAVIGANAVVLSDVPAGATAVGAPARSVVARAEGPKAA